MYLSARKYVGNWPRSGEEEKRAYQTVAEAVGIRTFEAPSWAPHLIVEVSVGYWRKANAIHKWFVDNCQGGLDNCMPYSVEREKLEELLRVCQEVLAHKGQPRGRDVAKNILPTAQGFFFGEAEFDDFYWDSLDHTVEQIRKILDNPELEGFEFTYRSSW